MSNNVMVLCEHVGKRVTDSTYELIGKARELAGAFGGQVEVALFGPADLAEQLGGADVVVNVDDPSLAEYVPECYERALMHVLGEREPRLLLLANATIGLDLGAAISVSWQAPLAAYCVGLAAEGDTLVATCQILGGKIMAEVETEGTKAVATVVGGAFPTEPGQGSGSPEVVTVSVPDLGSVRMSLTQTFEAQGGDVDITSVDMLVSVGRGIGSQDNLETVEELATSLGVPLSASRPVIDSGWLPKSRQVGKSGLKVKPRAYLAFGISGAPEHLEGMRSAELIIACNTDEQAPIFEIAHYGTTVDLFDLVPAIVERVQG